MKIAEGDIFISNLDGATFSVEKIVQLMVVLKSMDENREILTTLGNLDSFYRKKAPENEQPAERRKSIRYLVKDDVIASIHNGNMLVGKIRDISMGGLSIEHQRSIKQTRNLEGFEGNLYLMKDNFSLHKVVCKVIYDVPITKSDEDQRSSINLRPRRCGAKFQGLSDDQKLLLESFIEKYTQGVLPPQY